MEESKHKLIQEQPPAPRVSRPLLIVVSAPSGCGKSTLCDRLVEEFPKVNYSVSCTTRDPRGEEKDGVAYYFLSKKEFKERIKNGEFLEWAKVHGNFYGTLEDTILYSMEEGKHVLLDIDVQGAAQVRDCEDELIRASLVDLFVMPPSEKELAARLTGRATDSEEVIALRLKNAIEEMSHWSKYRYRLVSATREKASAACS